MIEIPFSVWSGLLLSVSVLILIVLIMIYRTLKHFRDYDDPEKDQIKLHFKDFKKG